MESIENILSGAELESVREIEEDMLDVRLAKLFLEKAPHIVCDAFTDDVGVEVIEDLRNPYLFAIEDKPVGRIPRRYNRTKLLETRRRHIEDFRKKRWEYLKFELHLRARYIKHYGRFLSKRRGEKVNIILTSTCWLKRASSAWYNLCAEQYKELGIGFGFKRGLERAVAISSISLAGEQKHYIIALEEDYVPEERKAQKASGGVVIVLGQGKYRVDNEKARKARAGFEALEETRKITILGRKRFES